MKIAKMIGVIVVIVLIATQVAAQTGGIGGQDTTQGETFVLSAEQELEFGPGINANSFGPAGGNREGIAFFPTGGEAKLNTIDLFGVGCPALFVYKLTSDGELILVDTICQGQVSEFIADAGAHYFFYTFLFETDVPDLVEPTVES